MHIFLQLICYHLIFVRKLRFFGNLASLWWFCSSYQKTPFVGVGGAWVTTVTHRICTRAFLRCNWLRIGSCAPLHCNWLRSCICVPFCCDWLGSSTWTPLCCDWLRICSCASPRWLLWSLEKVTNGCLNHEVMQYFAF